MNKTKTPTSSSSNLYRVNPKKQKRIVTPMDSSIPTTPISHQSKSHHVETNSPIPTPPSTKRSSSSIHSPSRAMSLQDLLLLSPSPYRKSRHRPRPIILDDECIESVGAALTPGSRRKGKSRAASGISPRNARRARRRLEKEAAREERELVVPFEEEIGRGRRKKQSRAKSCRNDKLALVASFDASSPSQKINKKEIEDDYDAARSENGPWELILELIMWKSAAKSSLWFGLGTMFMLSSCFSKDLSFSLISAFSHLGLLALGLAFFYDSCPQR